MNRKASASRQPSLKLTALLLITILIYSLMTLSVFATQAPSKTTATTTAAPTLAPTQAPTQTEPPRQNLVYLPFRIIWDNVPSDRIPSVVVLTIKPDNIPIYAMSYQFDNTFEWRALIEVPMGTGRVYVDHAAIEGFDYVLEGGMDIGYTLTYHLKGSVTTAATTSGPSKPTEAGATPAPTVDAPRVNETPPPVAASPAGTKVIHNPVATKVVSQNNPNPQATPATQQKLTEATDAGGYTPSERAAASSIAAAKAKAEGESGVPSWIFIAGGAIGIGAILTVRILLMRR